MRSATLRNVSPLRAIADQQIILTIGLRAERSDAVEAPNHATIRLVCEDAEHPIRLTQVHC